MKNIIRISVLAYCLSVTQSAKSQDLEWNSFLPGIWKATVGTPASISLLKAAAIKPMVPALEKLPATVFPLDKREIAFRIVNHKTYLRFPLDKTEQLFGLGLNFQSVNQRGRILDLHMDHYGGTDNGRTHAPVPFYISSNGYGVLIDAAEYITVYAGTAIRTDAKTPPTVYDRNTDANWEAQPYSDAVEILVPADGTDIYVIAGPTPMNVVQRYNLMNGGGCLPPKWGLGFTQRVPTLYSQNDVLNEVKSFEEHRFPLDFVGLEPGWQSNAYPCTFEWDKKRFPDPKGFLDSLKNRNIRTNLWFNPYVSQKSALYKSIKPFTGSHTVWNGLVTDFTIPQARQLYKEHFRKNTLNLGVSAYKIDEVDGFDNWIWPDVATFPSGTTAIQMRQTYGVQLQQMTTDWFREKNQRTYGLVRASNAGASSFPYVIYNDYYSHRDFINALINSSFIGVLWVPEVRASATAEEWVRRIQTVCFSPMAMLDAWSDGTKPWSFPEVENAVRDMSNLRMQLLPYLYTSFAQYRFEGKPPFRAMNLVEGFAFAPAATKGQVNSVSNPYGMSVRQDMKDQYMLGDYLLVAPLFTGEKSRKVILPAGKWYDFYSGKFVGENQQIEVSYGLDKIPLFVKDGGIIPMVPVHMHAPAPGEILPLQIRHYGTAEGSYDLYDDDGTSFNFERGLYSFTRITVKKDAKGNWQGSMEKPGAGKPFGYAAQVEWVFMSSEKKPIVNPKN